MQDGAEKRAAGTVARIYVPAVRATGIEIYGEERVAGSGVKDQQIGDQISDCDVIACCAG